MLKIMSSALGFAAIIVALVAPASATGRVYGDYGYDSDRYYHPVSSYDDDCGDDVAVGTGLGAIVGGVIGNQFGHGSGRAAATVGGVILGGIVGNKIAKDSCRDNHHDAYYYNDAYYDAFNEPDDREWEWRNPYNSHYGYIRTGEYYDDGWEDYEGPCREFTQRVYFDGRWHRAEGVACRQRDGSWRIVSGR